MLKVLVVDDEAPIRRWLEYCIDQFDGFTVAGVAASGTEGLEIYRRERPNIVVSDIEMPGMDGLEMLRRMQKIHPAYMIILTSHEKFSYARALNLGTAEYILKAEITMQSFQTVLLKAADTIRGRGVSDTGDAEQAARRFLKQLLADGWPGEEADIGGMLQRYGIRLRQKPFFAADILSRDGTELRALRRLAQDAPGLENLSMFPLDYDHLLIIANLGQEGGYPSVVQYFESKNHLSFIVGFSDPVRKLSELPETLRTAKARCNLHFYHPDRRVFWKETVSVLAPRHTEIWKASFSKALFGQNYREAAVIKDQAVQELLDDCQQHVAALNTELFTVQLALKHVENFKKAEAFACLSEQDLYNLERELAPLVHYAEPDFLALRFDSFMYTFMLDILENAPRVKYDISTLVKTVRQLQKLTSIPQVAEKLDLLKQIDNEAFWKNINTCELEHIRRELRSLIQFLGGGVKKAPIITNLSDPVLECNEGDTLVAEDVFENYEKKVNRYIEEHRDTPAIHNLIHNIPLTQQDYEELERIFTLELGSSEDYQKTFQDTPFGLLVRKIAKLDHEAAMNAFSEFINDNSLNSKQIEFVKKIILYIEQNGYIEDLAILTKPPFDKPAKLFDFNTTQQNKLIIAINSIKANAFAICSA